MLDGVVVFMASATEELRIVERGMAWQMCGEVSMCETQQIMDRLHGGDFCPTPQKGIARQCTPAQLFDVSIVIGPFENRLLRHEMRHRNP